jgi:hypothetical protein
MFCSRMTTLVFLTTPQHPPPLRRFPLPLHLDYEDKYLDQPTTASTPLIVNWLKERETQIISGRRKILIHIYTGNIRITIMSYQRRHHNQPGSPGESGRNESGSYGDSAYGGSYDERPSYGSGSQEYRSGGAPYNEGRDNYSNDRPSYSDPYGAGGQRGYGDDRGDRRTGHADERPSYGGGNRPGAYGYDDNTNQQYSSAGHHAQHRSGGESGGSYDESNYDGRRPQYSEERPSHGSGRPGGYGDRRPEFSEERPSPYSGGGPGGYNEQSQYGSSRSQGYGQDYEGHRPEFSEERPGPSSGGWSGGYGEQSQHGSNRSQGYGQSYEGRRPQDSSEHSSYPGSRPSGHASREDDDFSSAAHHAASQGRGSQSSFNEATSFLKQNMQRFSNEDINESDMARAHKALYSGGSGPGGQQSADSLGAGAAMQALKMFKSGGASSGGSQNQLIGMAMSQAEKLWNQQSSAGNVVSTMFPGPSPFQILVNFF